VKQLDGGGPGNLELGNCSEINLGMTDSSSEDEEDDDDQMSRFIGLQDERAEDAEVCIN
jgi:hypothetical protein